MHIHTIDRPVADRSLKKEKHPTPSRLDNSVLSLRQQRSSAITSNSSFFFFFVLFSYGLLILSSTPLSSAFNPIYMVFQPVSHRSNPRRQAALAHRTGHECQVDSP